MKKQIYLLLVAVALNLSNDAQAGSFYSTRRAFTPLFRQAGQTVSHRSGLSQSTINAARQFGTKSPTMFSTPMRQFSSQSTGKLTSEIVVRPNYSYWQQLKDSPTARRIAGLLAGGTLIGAGSVLGEEENQPKQVGWFERWFGKPSGYIEQDALKKAAISNNIKLIQDLLEKGVNVNARNSVGQTVLMIPSLNPDTVKTLIEAGADINAKDKLGLTPLMYAAQFNPEVIKELIHAGVDINAKDYLGWTALMRATETQLDSNPHVITELMQAGADINAKNNIGQTALMKMLEHRYEGKNNVSNIIKEFAQAGADINAKDDKGNTALMYAQNPADIKELIKAGADVNAKDENGYTALTLATYKSPDALKELIKGGANVNAKDDKGNTALIAYSYLVSHYGRLANFNPLTLETLIKAGADINAANRGGTTALMMIAGSSSSYHRNFKQDIMVKLIENGANINAKDNRGRTALDYAKKEYNHDLIDILKQAGAKE
jgi:ankyrin repeat protein